MRLTGAQIIIECLKEQGVDTVFGYPGGPCGGRVRQKHGQGRRLPGDERPWGDEPCHGDCDRLYGFGAVGGDYLQRGRAAPWERQLPGGGHCRDHDPDHEAQFYREGH